VGRPEPLVSYNKFHDFALQLGKGVHQLNVHTLKVYLSNAAPDADLHTIKANLAEIVAVNGYPAGGVDIQNEYTESGGVGTVSAVDVIFTASGGSFGPFRYVIIYNDTPTSPADPLICWWDYETSVIVNDGETFLVDFLNDILLTIA